MSTDRDLPGQVMALLTGKSCEYACARLDVPDLIGRSYAEAFDITWEEFTAYLEAHGLKVENYLSDSCFSLAQTGDAWTIYERWPAEKTPEYTTEYRHPNLDSARHDLLLRIVRYSGWKIRPKDHPDGPWIPLSTPLARPREGGWFSRLLGALFGG